MRHTLAGPYERTAGLGLRDSTEVLLAVLESDDEALREWFRRTFEVHRDEARPLDAGAFP